MEIRLNKYLAQCGVAARRKIDDLILIGAVKVNGNKAQLGDKIDPAKDSVTVYDKVIKNSEKLVYIAYNKPKGIISSVSDDRGRKTVIDEISKDEKLFPIGRLDLDSTGLMILTNDGALANELTHPKYHLPKTYVVTYHGEMKKSHLESLRNGVELEDGKTLPAEVTDVKENKEGGTLQMTIYQGKKRQIRRMFDMIGLKVWELERKSIGPIFLNDLKEGASRELSPDEITYLKAYVSANALKQEGKTYKK